MAMALAARLQMHPKQDKQRATHTDPAWSWHNGAGLKRIDTRGRRGEQSAAELSSAEGTR